MLCMETLVTIGICITQGLMAESENLFPSNMATIQGTPATFDCGTSEPNNTIAWYGQFQEIDSETDRGLYTGSRVTTDYQSIVSVEIVDNVSSLRINHTALSIAGTYICNERRTNRKSKAELIVLESEPVCITNHNSTDNTTLELSCSVSFRGNWAPIMEWREEGSVNVITSDVINQTMANDSVSYSLAVPLNVSRKSVRYTCTTRFIESMRPSSTNANNVPDLTLVWISPLVNFSNGMDQDTRNPSSSLSWWILLLVAVIVVLTLVIVVLSVSASINRIRRARRSRSSWQAKYTYSTAEPDLVDCSHRSDNSIQADNADGESSSGGAKNDAPIPTVVVGADGTAYTQVTLSQKSASLSSKQSSRTNQSRTNPTNNRNDYAMVDHLMKVPPPPPPQLPPKQSSSYYVNDDY